MKNGALTFAFLAFAGAVGGLSFAGCSSDPEEAPVTATDTGVAADTGTAPDTKPQDTMMPPPDTGAGCMQPLPGDFMCKAPTAKAGQTVCNDEAIKGLAECFGGDSMKCQAAYMKYTACRTCMLDAWLVQQRFVDTGSCIAKIDPTDKCGTLWQCNIDCQFEVCSEDYCSTDPGTGKTATSSEQDDCFSASIKKGGTTIPKGSCYDKATKPLNDAMCSTSNPKTAVCWVRTQDDVVKFFRGACRDNADWSQADVDKTPMTDAGADTATDTGAADTGPADTGAAADTLLPDVALDVLGD
jgi:hypothetical protein